MSEAYRSNPPPRSPKKNSPQKLKSFIITFFLLLTVFQTFLIHEAYAPPPPTTRTVPTADYPTIQSAITASSRGDIVKVNPGTYYEHLIIDKTNLKLIGADKYTTIIDGNATGTPVSLEAGGITVTGFTITDRGKHDYGIKSSLYNGHNITGNIIQNMLEGIYFVQSDSNFIVGNTFFNNSMRAINVGNSVSNQITDNVISESSFGVYLVLTDSTTVARNNISHTAFGIYSSETKENIISNNTEQSNSCGIKTYRSDHLTIDNNVITGGTYGIQLQNTNYTTLANNTLSHTSHGWGIYFLYSSYNTFGGTRGNLVNKNDWGIVIYNGTGNRIVDGNTIAESVWGISMTYYSTGNTIYHNNFFSNIKQVQYDMPDSYDNDWWNTSTLEGNYWDDYKGVPPAGGVDYYPLSQPWPMRNLAITSVTVSKTQFYPGDPVNVDVTVKNFGVIIESAQVTAYYGSTIIGTKTTTLAPNAAPTLTFNWNTINVPTGNYIVSAKVEPIPYVERNYNDNTLTDGTVQVGLLGDINGDHTVNNQDLIMLNQAYGAIPGSSNWSQNADLNKDNIIDLQDLLLLSKNYGK